MLNINRNYLYGSISISLITYYFVLQMKVHSNNSEIIFSAIGATLGAFILTLPLYAIVKYFLKLRNQNRSKNSLDNAYLITWGFLLLVTAVQQLPKKQDKEIEKAAAIKSAAIKFKEKFGTQYDTILDIEKYLDCAFSKILELPTSEIEKVLPYMTDPNSKVFNEILFPCGKQAFIYKESYTSAVLGFVNSDTVSGVSTTMGTKVKLTIGNTEYFYIIDSGASELFISSKLFSTYKNENPELKIKELPSEKFVLANGIIQLCRRYQFEKVQLGKYIIPNVIFAINEDDCNPLLGQDILSRFKSWSIIDNNEKLVLNK